MPPEFTLLPVLFIKVFVQEEYIKNPKEPVEIPVLFIKILFSEEVNVNPLEFELPNPKPVLLTK